MKPPTNVNYLFPGLNPGIQLTSIDTETEEWDKIERYFLTTQGATHNFNVQLEDIIRVENPHENRPHFPGDKMLLWHGTSKRNITPIINQGLLKEKVRQSGLMFGKGLYFADSFSKSAQYIWHGNALVTPDNYILLCEVSLGNMFIAFQSITQSTIDMIIENGYDSIKGSGRSCSSERDGQLHGSTKIPSGILRQMDHMDAAGLLYNEYIVYDDRRIKLKYVVKFKRV